MFVAAGVAAQCCSLVAEALRLTLVQLLLQQRGFKLHPVATMYFVSPVCLMALLVPFAMLEAEQVSGGARELCGSQQRARMSHGKMGGGVPCCAASRPSAVVAVA